MNSPLCACSVLGGALRGEGVARRGILRVRHCILGKLLHSLDSQPGCVRGLRGFLDQLPRFLRRLPGFLWRLRGSFGRLPGFLSRLLHSLGRLLGFLNRLLHFLNRLLGFFEQLPGILALLLAEVGADGGAARGRTGEGRLFCPIFFAGRSGAGWFGAARAGARGVFPTLLRGQTMPLPS